VGLGNVQNYGIATDAEAQAGLRNDVYMTALRTKTAINAIAGALLNNHTTDRANPHGTTAAQVGLGNVQNYTMASNAEALAGALTTRYMSPANVKAVVDQFSAGAFSTHVNNKLNPHEVDKVQVGLAYVENYGMASANDAQAGTRNDVYMTPLRVRQAIASLAGGDLSAHVTDYGNPHQVTKAQLGLSNVLNYGTADSATTLSGVATNLWTTPKGVVDAIKALVADDYHEHEINTSNPHQVTAEQVGAYDKTAINNLLSGYLPVGGKAVNSTRFDGMVIDEYKDYVLAGKSGNTALFNGRNQDDYKAWVLLGKAADATLFNGLTLEQVITQAQSNSTGAFAGQWSGAALASAVGDVNTWTLLGTVDGMNNTTPDEGYPDTQWLVAGCEGASSSASALYYLRCSVRGAGTGAAQISLQALNMAGVDVSAKFGYTFDATAQVASIYLRSAPYRNPVSVTELAGNAGTVSTTLTGTGVEPTGIVYVTEDGLATQSQFKALQDQMEQVVISITNAFTAMVP
jgi:hypothetical protein